MKKSIFLSGSIVIVITVCIMSCTKQNNSTNNTATTTTGANNNGPTHISTLTLTPQGNPTGTNFSGTLFRLKKWGAGNQSVSHSVTATFFNTAPANPLLLSAANSVQVGWVNVNDTALVWSASNGTYNGAENIENGTNWVVNLGASSIPSFTYTTSMSFPAVGGYLSAITINRSNGYTLNSFVYGGYDMIIASIKDASGHDTIISGKNGNIPTFSAGALSTLLPGTGYLDVTMYSYDGETINGKNFLFVTGTVASTQTVTLQ